MPEPSPDSATAVCVFCASSEDVAVEHRVTARALGAAIARRGWSLVYGGGGIGLMGELARAALDGGGRVIGVIPERLVHRELALPEVTELVRVETMRERKAEMDSRSDGFVVLPGGIGTLEELVEILTLRQLGYHDRPVVLLDPTDFWAPLVALLEHMVAARLAPLSLLDSYVVTRDVDAALDAAASRAPAREPSELEELEAVEPPPR